MLNHRHPLTQWGVLFVVSLLLVLLMRAIALPGALLLGPMAAGIIVALNGGRIGIPVRLYQCAQAVIGCMIASTLTSDILHALLKDGFLFLGLILASLFISGLIGWTLARLKVMPGTTAIWGTTPGAAAAMVVMAEYYGADVRLVAFMQYLRVICVAVTASLAAHFFVADTSTHPVIAHDWLVWPHWLFFGETLLLIISGAAVGWLLKIPSGTMLVPLTIGAALNVSGCITIELPPWLLVLAFGTIGWVVGLRFTRQVLHYAFHALPKILLSIAALMAFCAVLAMGLTWWLGIDPLTAFLATSPGGADAMVIIAASSQVDLSFVMGMQVARLIVVLLLGPPMARWIAHRLQQR